MLENPQHVLPIFYDVEPKHLRFLNEGPLACGFNALKRRFNKEVIEQWKAYLNEASQINGWVHCGPGKRFEKDLVKEAVQKVYELANKPLPLVVGEHVFGVKNVVKDIIKTIDDRKKVVMLVLWGTGGIGKSTLSREMYNQLHLKYTSSCFVEDVKEVVKRKLWLLMGTLIFGLVMALSELTALFLA